MSLHSKSTYKTNWRPCIFKCVHSQRRGTVRPVKCSPTACFCGASPQAFLNIACHGLVDQELLHAARYVMAQSALVLPDMHGPHVPNTNVIGCCCICAMPSTCMQETNEWLPPQHVGPAGRRQLCTFVRYQVQHAAQMPRRSCC
jgi:hypothetical protein